MEQRYPRSSHLPELQSLLLTAYAARGETDEVIKRGQQFLVCTPIRPGSDYRCGC